MNGKPQNPKDLTESQKKEIMAKSAALKDLANHPGWPVFVDILSSAVEVDEKVDSVETDGLSDAAIGRELKIRKSVLRRLRMVTDNVVSLVEKGDNYRRIEKLKSQPSHILHRSMKK